MPPADQSGANDCTMVFIKLSWQPVKTTYLCPLLSRFLLKWVKQNSLFCHLFWLAQIAKIIETPALLQLTCMNYTLHISQCLSFCLLVCSNNQRVLFFRESKSRQGSILHCTWLGAIQCHWYEVELGSLVHVVVLVLHYVQWKSKVQFT